MAQFDFKQAIAKVEANKPKPAGAGYNDGMDALEAQMKGAAAKGQADIAAKDAKLQSFADQTAANQAQKLSGYEQQLAAAEKGIATFDQREGAISQEAAAAARNLNRQGSAVAARSRNLGTLRGMADQTGITRAQMGSEYERQQLANAAQRMLAQQQAGALQSTLAEERQQALVNATTGASDALNQKYAQVDEIAAAAAAANPIHLSDEDVMRTAEEMRQKVMASATTEAERKAIEKYIYDYIQNNT